MPIIITVHMAKSSATCRASHDAVIIQADGPDIAPYMSRAIGTIHVQHSTVTPSSTAIGIARSVRAFRRGSKVRGL
jgi:hypothetical protein